MIKLSDAEVAEFAKIVREDCGVDLDPDAARLEAESLMRFAMAILHPPKPKEK